MSKEFKLVIIWILLVAGLMVATGTYAAKTTFIDGTPSLGIKGTKVTAAYLNAINKHFQTGLDTDGDGSLPYSAVTGTNALISTITPTAYFPASYVAGMPIYLKSAATNTGAMTLNINSIGTGTIKKNGSEDLAAGDVQAGQLMAVAFDGTNFQMLSPTKRINSVYDGTNSIKIKIIDIGDWNMDSTVSVDVPHGLTLAKIRSVSGVIRNDLNDYHQPITPGNIAAAPVYIATVGTSVVSLYRATSGIYDSADYDSTSYNRGWLVITYVE